MRCHSRQYRLAHPPIVCTVLSRVQRHASPLSHAARAATESIGASSFQRQLSSTRDVHRQQPFLAMQSRRNVRYGVQFVQVMSTNQQLGSLGMPFRNGTI